MPRTLTQHVRNGALAGAVLVAASALVAPSVLAQQSPGSTAAKKSAAKAKPKSKRLSRKQAEAELREGYRALQAKETKKAIAALTRALDAGSLRRKEMAKALYYRGIAHRTSDQAAKAISDLTSSLWLKGALSKKERADALAQRKQAYASAGVGGGLLAAPRSSASTPPAPAASTNRPQPAAKKPKPAEKTQTAAIGTWKSTTEASPLPKTTGSTTSSNSANGVTSFFSSLFGGSSQPAKQPQTAALAKPNPNGTTSSVSSWSSKRKASNAKSAGRRSSARTKPAKPAKPAGNYHVQVASYRSRGRADAVVRRIVKNYGGLLSGRQPIVEATVVAGMGQFYQVRIKRYRNAREPAALCKKLIAGGLDCFVRRGK